MEEKEKSELAKRLLNTDSVKSFSIDEINADYFVGWDYSRDVAWRGAMVIIGDDGNYLFCGISSYPFEFYVEEYKKGKRSNMK